MRHHVDCHGCSQDKNVFLPWSDLHAVCIANPEPSLRDFGNLGASFLDLVFVVEDIALHLQIRAVADLDDPALATTDWNCIIHQERLLVFTAIFQAFPAFNEIHHGMHQRIGAGVRQCRDRKHRSVPVQGIDNLATTLITLILGNKIGLVQHQPAVPSGQRVIILLQLGNDGRRIGKRVGIWPHVEQVQQQMGTRQVLQELDTQARTDVGGKLPVEDRIVLVQRVWDAIADSDTPLELTDEQKAEISRRSAELDANPDIAVPWEEVKRSLDERRNG